jgi:hypothetical protein
MRWIQLLLLVIVLELGIIAVRLPESVVRASPSATQVCIQSYIQQMGCLGSSAYPLSVVIEGR